MKVGWHNLLLPLLFLLSRPLVALWPAPWRDIPCRAPGSLPMFLDLNRRMKVFSVCLTPVAPLKLIVQIFELLTAEFTQWTELTIPLGDVNPDYVDVRGVTSFPNPCIPVAPQATHDVLKPPTCRRRNCWCFFPRTTQIAFNRDKRQSFRNKIILIPNQLVQKV